MIPSAIGQEETNEFKNDISIQYRKDKNKWFSKHDSFTIQYRRSIANRFFVKLGYSNYARNFIDVNTQVEYELNDSTLLVRNQYAYGSGFQFKVGANYAVSKYFNIGLDFIIGSGELNSYTIDDGFTRYNGNQKWRYDNQVILDYHSLDNYSGYNPVLEVKQNVVGFGLDGEFVYPIWERFEAGLRYTHEFRHFQNSTQTIIYTKDNQFETDIADYWSNRHLTYLVLRFKF